MKSWPINKVLLEKYRFKQYEAKLFSDFLNRMLQWSPKARAKASDLLNDPFLKLSTADEEMYGEEAHMSRAFYKEWKKASDPNFKDDKSSSSGSSESSSGSDSGSDDSDSGSQSDESSDGDSKSEASEQDDEESDDKSLRKT